MSSFELNSLYQRELLIVKLNIVFGNKFNLIELKVLNFYKQMDKPENSLGPICSKQNHTPNTLDYICLTEKCRINGPICSKCIEENHLDHKDFCITMEDFLNKLRSSVEIYKSSKLNRFHKSIYDSITLIRKSLTTLTNTLNEMSNDIRDSYDKIIQKLIKNNSEYEDLNQITHKFLNNDFKDVKDFQESWKVIEKMFHILPSSYNQIEEKTHEPYLLKIKETFDNSKIIEKAIEDFNNNKEKISIFFKNFQEKLEQKPTLVKFSLDVIIYCSY